MGWPQYIIAAVLVLQAVANVIHHGESRGEFNAGAGVSAAAVYALLLHVGGFWTAYP